MPRTNLRRISRNRPHTGVHDPQYGVMWSNKFAMVLPTIGDPWLHSACNRVGQFRRSPPYPVATPLSLQVRPPILPPPQRRRQYPHRPPVVIARGLRFLAGPALQHPAQMLGLPLMRLADAEAFLNRTSNSFAPLNMADDARLRSWQ